MTTDTTSTSGGNTAELIFAWVWVGIPLAWGVWVTIGNAARLFAK
jgi:hypothetical protein